MSKGVDFEMTKKFFEEISGYIEVDAPEDFVDEEKFLLERKDCYGGVIAYNGYTDRFTIYISDLSWNSHIYDDAWSDLEKALYRNMVLLERVSLSLWYLSETHKNLYLDSQRDFEELKPNDEVYDEGGD